MKVIVNAHTIQLDKTTIVNKGEYNIQECEFEFSSEYNGLVEVALFSTCSNTYQINIVNNKCSIPYEVLQEEGNIILGVYGYEVDGEELIKRYSPTPVYFTVDNGSFLEGIEPTPPSPSVIEQMQQEITDNTNNISELQTTKADKSEIPTKTSQLENDSDFAYKSDIPDVSNYVTKDTTELENYTLTSNLSNVALSGNYNDLSNKPDLSNYITKDVDDLTYYTKTSDLSTVATTGNYSDLNGTPDLSVYATTQALGNETTARENADIGLQGQIDAITSSSDVKDIVGTYTELENYDTSTLGNDDIIKVLQDSTHNDAMTYYRWVITGSTGAWQYIGQEGPYYTKSEIDTTLQGYVEDSDLTDYVKNTDYAGINKAGIIKIQNWSGLYNDGTDGLYVQSKNYANYLSGTNTLAISKGTLENVIAGKQLVNQTYVDNLVGDIASVIDTINGEVVN